MKNIKKLDPDVSLPGFLRKTRRGIFFGTHWMLYKREGKK
jgi:hypothetical protein